jgi:hypothetical protein
MLGRGSDRILGAFFHEATHFSPAMSGAFTLSSTFGLLHGLSAGRNFGAMDGPEKERFMERRYVGAILSDKYHWQYVRNACADFIQRPKLVAVWIALSAFGLTSNTVFLFFNIPNIVANTFPSQAVCSEYH